MLSPYPFDNTIEIPLTTRSINITLGILVKLGTQMNRIKLINCITGAPTVKIPRWCSAIKNGLITKLNGINVTSIPQLKEMITKVGLIKETIVTIIVSTVIRSAMHPIFGVPQLHHDQLNIISDHLKSIKSDIQL